ncbi:MAG: VWA domain-containing protein [Bacteroidaceae bacterium]|nr:VWA domain-containing protein [Bacteroidaceae bacterium]
MGLCDNESIPRRKMTLFFVIDTSGSMTGSKIGSVNDAIENVLPMIGEISDENPDAEINIAALEFSTGTRWLYDAPKEAKEFIWQNVEADGLTSLGEACEELNKKLSRNGGFMSSPSGCFAPAIILLSDGGPTDNFEDGLKSLQDNSWYKNAIKIAIAIGDDADKHVLKKFTGSAEAVITVHNIDALKQMIRIIAITSSQIGSKSTSATDATKQEQVIEEVNKAAADIDGVETAAAPAPAAGDSYDEWE